MKKFGDPSFYRFIVAGSLNTGLTYLIYLVFLYIMPYALAYTVTFVLGVAIGYFLNAKWVYRRITRSGTAIGYSLIYLINYCLGIVLLYVFVDLFAIPTTVAPIGVVAFSVPVSYLLTRALFKGETT